MKTLTVEVCVGTACYIQGGADILDAAELAYKRCEHIAPGSLQLSSVPCLGECEAPETGLPPFVRFNGELRSCSSAQDFYDELIKRFDAIVVEKC